MAEYNLETAPYELLVNSGVANSLAKNLHLTDVQVAKANQSLLALLTDEKLKDCSQGSKLRFAYTTALYDYKHPNAVAPVPYGGNVQAQLQYQAYMEDILTCGHVVDTDCVAVYKGVDYKFFINQWDYKELVIPEKIELNDMFENKEVVGYYAYAKCDDGKVITCLMSITEINEWAERYSKSYKVDEKKKNIWKDNYEKMAKKTVIKRMAREVLQNYPFDRLAWALRLDQAVMTENGMEYQDNPQNESVEATPKETITNTLEKPQD